MDGGQREQPETGERGKGAEEGCPPESDERGRESVSALESYLR